MWPGSEDDQGGAGGNHQVEPHLVETSVSRGSMKYDSRVLWEVQSGSSWPKPDGNLSKRPLFCNIRVLRVSQQESLCQCGAGVRCQNIPEWERSLCSGCVHRAGGSCRARGIWVARSSWTAASAATCGLTRSCPRSSPTDTGPGGRHSPSVWTWSDRNKESYLGCWPWTHTYIVLLTARQLAYLDRKSDLLNCWNEKLYESEYQLHVAQRGLHAKLKISSCNCVRTLNPNPSHPGMLYLFTPNLVATGGFLKNVSKRAKKAIDSFPVATRGVCLSLFPTYMYTFNITPTVTTEGLSPRCLAKITRSPRCNVSITAGVDTNLCLLQSYLTLKSQ